MSKYFWMKICGANLEGEGGIGSKFFWRQIFLRKFGEQIFLQVKFHSGKKRILGSKNVVERKDTGSKKFWGAKKIVGGGGGGGCKQNLGNKNLLG